MHVMIIRKADAGKTIIIIIIIGIIMFSAGYFGQMRARAQYLKSLNLSLIHI